MILLKQSTAVTLLVGPFLDDTDGDGLSDGDEFHTYSTDPFLIDTDGLPPVSIQSLFF